MQHNQQSFNEFREAVQHHSRGTFKVTNSWGIYDAYKHIRKNKWYNIGRPVKEHEFYTIVRQVNDLLANELIKGNTVVFPAKMGKLELRKSKRRVKMVDGELKNSYPIDWNSTMKLWYEDAEARKQKTLIRFEQEYVYHVKYCKFMASYENKCFYEFYLNTFIKKKLKNSIINRKTETLW
jgi:hypothetical protein